MTIFAAMDPDTISLGAMPRDADVLCVFVHGRGQSPQTMVEHVAARLPLDGVAMVLPAAPGTAWYEARAVDPLTDTTARQLDAALDRLDRTVDAALAAGARADRLVLAGFSQGACLALEYALRRRRPAGLACLTGCRVGYPLEEAPKSLAGLPVYLSCGDADPWIPLDPFFAAARQLAGAGAGLRLDIVPGRPHEVSDREIAALQALLSDVAAKGVTTDGATG